MQDKTTLDDDLKALLGHVEERIKIGLDEAWLSEYGYGYRPPPQMADFATKQEFEEAQTTSSEFATNLIRLYNEPEEKWARALTEMFVFLMYGEPNIAYSRVEEDGIVLTDTQFYQNFPKTYPLALACQHLSTFAVLSRGYTVSDVGASGLACSGNSARLPAFKKGKKFSRKGEYGTTPSILVHVGPGDAVFFNFHGVDSTSQLPGLLDVEKKQAFQKLESYTLVQCCVSGVSGSNILLQEYS